MNTIFISSKYYGGFSPRALTSAGSSAKRQSMEPAPIRNKPLFYGLVTLSFGILGLAIILLSL